MNDVYKYPKNTFQVPPPLDTFYYDYLIITEGTAPRNVHSRKALFQRLVSKLKPDDEHTFVKFVKSSSDLLIKWHFHKYGDGPKPRKTCHFETYEHFFSFVAGVVHYCPQVLINQLHSKKAMCRLAVVELINFLTEFLYDDEHISVFQHIFFIRTLDSSLCSVIVFDEFLKRATDSSLLVRRSFVATTYILLSKIPSVEIPSWSLHNLTDRMTNDPSKMIRVKAISALNWHFSDTRKLKSVVDEKLLDHLARMCFDRNPDIQRLAVIVATKAYISLMKQFPVDGIIPPMDAVGRLPAVLFKVSLRTTGRMQAMLQNFILLIETFLLHTKNGESYPVEEYFEHQLMKCFWD